MSATINTTTDYHEDPQDVAYKINAVRVDNIRTPQKIVIWGQLLGTVGTPNGIVDSAESSFSRADLDEHFTATEKTAARKFVAACERVIALKVAKLAESTIVDTDVMS